LTFAPRFTISRTKSALERAAGTGRRRGITAVARACADSFRTADHPPERWLNTVAYGESHYGQRPRPHPRFLRTSRKAGPSSRRGLNEYRSLRFSWPRHFGRTSPCSRPPVSRGPCRR
jgi:hypothetical protein